MKIEFRNHPLVRLICERTGRPDVMRAIEVVGTSALRDAQVDDVPVSLMPLAESLGIRQVEYAAISCEAQLLPIDSKTYRVIISRHSTPERQRFSFAHEIAHAIIHRLAPETRQPETRNLFVPQGSEVEERLCDAIAGALLMPESAARERLESRRPSLELLKSFAADFRVSLSAAAVRLKSLLSEDYALLKLRAFTSEQLAVLDRTLVDFWRSPLRCKPGMIFDGPCLFAAVAANRAKGMGWEWLRLGFQRRRLFLECEAPSTVNSAFLVLVARSDFGMQDGWLATKPAEVLDPVIARCAECA